jgi:hypothetical protein
VLYVSKELDYTMQTKLTCEGINIMIYKILSIFWHPRVDIYQYIQYFSVTTTK